jgi:UDP-glucose 4-epimerase
MNILITGGAGFIGSHIVDACVARGDTVAVIDNLSTGNRTNIAAHIAQCTLTFHQGDIQDMTTMLPLFESFRPDVVYHLAAQINVRASMNDPLNDAHTNIL